VAQFRQDRMTEKERLGALLNRQQVDRVAFFPMHDAFAAAMVGYSKADIYENPDMAFWAKVRTQEMFGAVDRVSYSAGAFGAREFGSEVRMPTSEYAMAISIIKFAVQSEEDVWRLEVPDVKTAGGLPLSMRFSKLQAEHDLPISFNCGSILTTAGYITGVERMCRWMIRKPKLVHRLCRIVTDFFVAVAEYWVETFGPEHMLPSSLAPTEANQIISPKQFEEFCLPYQTEVHEKLFTLGVKHILTHICGEQNLNLPLWAQIPMGDPGIVTVGHEVDLETASKYFPNDIIMGNVEPAVIQTGTTEQVYELSRICIEKGKKHPGGFVLGPGCELSPKSPPYNVWTMRKAINDFGWFD
jgi:uroporphyrinogen decarboxylase